MSDDLRPADDLADIEAILRSMSDADLELEAPPQSVWDGIAAAGTITTADTEAEAETAPLAPVVTLADRRRPLVLGAVAAALVVIAGIVAVLVTNDSADPVEVASAALVHVADDAAFVELGVGRHADVTLIADDGAERVRVDVADLPDTGDDSDLEIWLIGLTDGGAEVVPLGLIEDSADPGTFTVPADFDRSAYDAVAVDISVEPHDGDEAHSGMSLVRGVLTA